MRKKNKFSVPPFITYINNKINITEKIKSHVNVAIILDTSYAGLKKKIVDSIYILILDFNNISIKSKLKYI